MQMKNVRVKTRHKNTRYIQFLISALRCTKAL